MGTGVKPLALVLHDRVLADAPPDQLDTLDQARAVSRALAELGYRVATLDLDLDLAAAKARLAGLAPEVVVNLAESIGGDARLAHLPVLLLEMVGLPFTGCPSEALWMTTNKPLTKRLLRAAGLPTPDWCLSSGPFEGPQGEGPPCPGPGPWLVKSVYEEASLGLDAGALVAGSEDLATRLAQAARTQGGACFAERYVEGREFNVGLLEGPRGPEVLPIAEMCFVDFPPGMPRILDYASKWDPTSFGYRNTRRDFDWAARHDQPNDGRLRDTLARLALACWSLLGLRGYARVDFRVDAAGAPFILEVNANPCIAPDAGFTAAAAAAGLAMRDLVARLLAAAGRT